MLWREMSVAQGHIETGVPKKFPDRIQVHTPHRQIACEGVSEVVPTKVDQIGLGPKRRPGLFSIDGRP